MLARQTWALRTGVRPKCFQHIDELASLNEGPAIQHHDDLSSKVYQAEGKNL